MTLLERYIFKRAFVYSLSSLASLVLIVWIVQALQRIDIVKTSASAAGNIFWIALMLVPNLAAGVLPFAILIGSIQALNALNGDSELAVVSSAGASRMVVIRPLLLLGALAGAVLLFNSHVLGPAASSAFQNGLRSINADALTLFLRPGRFEEIQDDLVISVGDASGSRIESLFISDMRDPETEITYFAREGHVLERDGMSFLLLNNGQLHRRSVEDGTVSIIQFQTYAFDLAELRPSNDGDWIRTSERSTAQLISPDLNDELFQQQPRVLTQELTQRLTDWLYPFAFVLWALVVASRPRTNRQGPGLAMTFGLAGALGLKAVGFLTLSLVARHEAFRLVVYALPVTAIAFNTWLLARNVDLAELAAFNRLGARLRSMGAARRRRRSGGIAAGTGTRP